MEETGGWVHGIAGELHELMVRASGHVGMTIRDLRSGHEVTWQPDRVFPSASVIKLPVLVAALDQAESSRLDLDRTVSVSHDARVGGSGILKELRLDALSMRDLLTLMIVLSDNTATNVCLERVGFPVVNDCARRGGCESTRCERLLMDTDARRRGWRNETSARDMAEFVSRLTRGELLSPDGTAYALDVLRRQQSRWDLALRLPEGVDLAHKTGELQGLRHDVGLLTVGGEQAAIAVLCDGFIDPQMPENLVGGEASDLLANIGDLVFAAMSVQAPAGFGTS